MPIYHYRCDACGHEFQRKQRMSDDPERMCPECEGPVRRIIQPVGVIFRGSGFYITDNRQVSSPTLTPPKEGAKAKEESDGGDSQAPATSETPAKSEAPAKSETSGTADKSDA
ncbi:MAG: zinc ribbon domain-containing protein [Anaerolineae bacterium]|nr:zinc ribbon domain-containing protein [Anaerolineae bacterium]